MSDQITAVGSASPRVRTVAYFAVLAASAVVLLVTGLAPIWLDADGSARVVASCGVITSVIGVVAGGFGVAHRPTKERS